MNNSNVINLPSANNNGANNNDTSEGNGLSASIHSSLSQYLSDLDGENPNNVYDMVMAQVEAPLLSLIMQHVDGNQSKAAECLGINRGTLRKKLKTYNLIK